MRVNGAVIQPLVFVEQNIPGAVTAANPLEIPTPTGVGVVPLFHAAP